MRGPAPRTAWRAPDQLGRAVRLEDARGRYIEVLKASLPRGMTLDGLKIVVDCANGAAYGVAPKVLWELGAEVIEIGTQPERLQHQRPLRLDRARGDARRGARARRRPRHRARRRRRSHRPGGRARRDHRRRPDAGAARPELADATACCAATAWSRPSMSNLGLERHLRGPRAAPAPHPGRRSLRGRADARAPATISAASSRATSSCPTSRPPATACSPRCRCSR